MDRLTRLVINPQAQVTGLRSLIDYGDDVGGIFRFISGKGEPLLLLTGSLAFQLSV